MWKFLIFSIFTNACSIDDNQQQNLLNQVSLKREAKLNIVNKRNGELSVKVTGFREISELTHEFKTKQSHEETWKYSLGRRVSGEGPQNDWDVQLEIFDGKEKIFRRYYRLFHK